MKFPGLTILLAVSIPQTIQLELFDENTLMPVLMNFLNNVTRAYEKYILRVDDIFWQLSDETDPEYDFVIVGSGSAGSVIASRLSEVPEWRVLLLEAGEPEDSFVDVPLMVLSIQGTKYDWAFRTVTLTNMGFGLEDQKMKIPRGKALGGSSVLNYMMYCRGNRWDYERWAALGNPGWSYNDVLPYFMKSEGAKLPDADYRYHNRDGYLSVEYSYQSAFVPVFVEGGEEVGLPRIDYNAPTESYGVSPIQSTLHEGRRESVAKAFLGPTASRRNLDIVTGAFVTRVLVNGRREAYGVAYEKDGMNRTVRARKEVILSAGAINTPQLLMLSGIGPRTHLSQLGIECVQDLAVGENLQDHITFNAVVYKIPFDPDQGVMKLLTSYPDYIFSGTGMLTSIGGIQGVAYVKTEVSKVPEDQPDIEFMFGGGSLASGYGSFISTDFGMKPEYYESIYLPLEAEHQWTIAPVLLHPKSKGYVRLNTTNPHDHPLIDPRYFTDPENEDIKTMIAGIRQIQRLGATEAFKKKGATLHDLPLYGCTTMAFDSDEYWECALRAIANTLYHQVGTAKMGPRSDREAVVDHLLQVYGVGNLRVADCSVIPTHISGHTNAAAIMIGEKVSDFVKEKWGMMEERPTYE